MFIKLDIIAIISALLSTSILGAILFLLVTFFCEKNKKKSEPKSNKSFKNLTDR